MPVGEIIQRLKDALANTNMQINELEMQRKRDNCDQERLCYLYERAHYLEKILNG